MLGVMDGFYVEMGRFLWGVAFFFGLFALCVAYVFVCAGIEYVRDLFKGEKK